MVYQGDDVLAALLAKAETSFNAAGVRALIRGVLGSAPTRDRDLWCRLVTSDPSPALVAQLQALKAEIAEAEAKRILPPIPERVAALRKMFARQGVSGFIVPRSDEYQNEYVPAYAERLAWLTGFTGSAGMAIVLADKAAIFVDGRYTLQVRTQTDLTLFEPEHLIEFPPERWLEATLSAGQVIGYDPLLITPSHLDRLSRAAEKVGASLKPLDANPLDAAWGEARPAAPLGPVLPHTLQFSGKEATEKRGDIAAALKADRLDALIVTAADSLAWLLNIRGSDVPHTPLALGFAILEPSGKVTLFIDQRKCLPELSKHLGSDVALRNLDDFGAALEGLTGKRVRVDPSTANAWIFDRLAAAGADIQRGVDPITLPKALKNPAELDGTRAAHLRDGVAMARFLHFLDGAAVNRPISEIQLSDRLEAFRETGEHFRDLSFPSISGAGPNGAIVHYRAMPETDRVLDRNSLYLIDSGAQYLDGTTDITRTIAIGTPSPEMKDRFTRVLKGHIALAKAVFPKGTTGSQLDALARMPLWVAGLNYDHGTGHGVGSYLGVHEGPQRISGAASTQALLPGMVISNEPGYYRTDGYGIRIENLVAVTRVEIADAERDMLGFETLTLCPIDRRAIDLSLLSAPELDWLDLYHARVWESVSPLLDDAETRDWLAQATAPLSPAAG